MDSIIIEGGKALNGAIEISGAKNAALPIIASALLTAEKLVVTNVPKLTDITTMIDLLKNHGSIIEVQDFPDSLSLSIDCSKISHCKASYDIVRKMRASIWVLGPLLSRFGHAEVSLPGGCAIGVRQIDLHLQALTSMGALIEIQNGYVIAKAPNGLKGAHISFDKVSVGATINTIMAASLADGETVLYNCAKEPEIVDLCHCLQKMGAEIEGIGTSEVRVIGKSHLHSASYRVMPDRIEAGTYMIAAGMTKGELYINGIDFKLIEGLALKLSEAGLIVKETEQGVLVKYNGKLKAVDVQTQSYPGFPTDLQAQFMSLMCIAEGSSSIVENIFENRFMHAPELCRMGANISVNGHNAIVRGIDQLNGAEVMASDLRASVSLVLAGLAARGQTKILRVYHLDRGYQSLEEKLSNVGGSIYRIKT